MFPSAFVAAEPNFESTTHVTVFQTAPPRSMMIACPTTSLDDSQKSHPTAIVSLYMYMHMSCTCHAHVHVHAHVVVVEGRDVRPRSQAHQASPLSVTQCQHTHAWSSDSRGDACRGSTHVHTRHRRVVRCEAAASHASRWKNAWPVERGKVCVEVTRGWRRSQQPVEPDDTPSAISVALAGRSARPAADGPKAGEARLEDAGDARRRHEDPAAEQNGREEEDEEGGPPRPVD